MTNRAGMVRRATDRLAAIGGRSWLSERGFKRGAQRTFESTPTEAVDAWRMCATHRPFTTAVLGAISSREGARSGFRWGHRPFGGAPGRDGQCAGRSQVAVALCTVADGVGRRILSCDRSNRSGLGCLWLRTYGPAD